MTSLGYQVKNKKQTASFTCCNQFQIGAYTLQEGDRIKVMEDSVNRGLFYVYVEWAEGAVTKLNAAAVNRLAGFQAVQ